ncbi:phospholipase D-like domain-containing protein, partial [Halieaceae bacterium]|nr:phospholipase D-like domain-containing protein [Halieaceae bacterium]
SDLSGVFDLYWNDPWTIPIENLTAGREGLDLQAARKMLGESDIPVTPPQTASQAEWAELFATGVGGQLRLIVDAPPDVSPDEDLPVQLAESFIHRIDAVQSDLLLVSAYFIPTQPLTDALRRATERGVRVRILTNSLGSNNHVTAHASYAHHRPELLQAGVELFELRADASDRANYIFGAVEDSALGLHAKIGIFDDCCLFVGSSNLDPRSLRINTEVGALINSPELNRQLREFFAVDLLPRNAWQVMLDENRKVVWHGEDGVVLDAPPASFFMRAESWFFGLLPIEDEM